MEVNYRCELSVSTVKMAYSTKICYHKYKTNLGSKLEVLTAMLLKIHVSSGLLI